LVKTNDNILNAISSLRSVLSNINLLLTDSYSLAEAIIVNANYPQAIKDTIKADISTQQATNSASSANIQLARSNLTSSVSNYSSQIAAAQNSLSIYQAQLDLKQSGPRSFEVQSALASLSQAKAQLAKAQLDLQDYNLIAPISGIVTKVNINKGEQSSVALVAVKILTVENYQVKVDVPESDIAKIKVGDKVSVQLDAFGSDHIFSGSISFIEPAQTVIQDVIYYKTTVVFDQDSWSNRLRSGMTADVIVSTAKKQDALYIPSKAIKIKEGIIDKKITRVVEVLQPLDKVEEKIIETGIRADGGLVEVLSGLNEGENVVIFKKTSTN
ncbi:MAG: efflux RND transporter periplasmic adaptor subunit, partial [bacterium]